MDPDIEGRDVDCAAMAVLASEVDVDSVAGLVGRLDSDDGGSPGSGVLAFATYGVAFSDCLEALAHGTTMGTLRRHLVLVMVAATGVAVADLAAVLAPGAVTESTGYVFLVLLGGLLVPPTVRLQQSIAGRT